MHPDRLPSRRDLLRCSGLAAAGLGAGAALGRVAQADAPDRDRRCARPLAQQYTVIYRKPDHPGLMVDTPCIARLRGGRLLASNNLDGSWGGGVGQAGLDKVRPGGRNFFVHASDDDGRTWHQLAELPLADGMLVSLGGAVYVLGTGRAGRDRRDVFILRSTDAGQTWTDPVQLHDGLAWNSATGIVFKNGQLYRAYDTATHYKSRRLFVVAGDVGRDLLDPAAWRVSNEVDFPGMPDALKRPLNPRYRDHWLEPNVVDIRGRLAVIARCRIDDYATCNLAGVCDLRDEGGQLELKFTQFYPVPGAQQKFHILYDRPSDLFWMVHSMVTDPQNHTGWAAAAKRRGFLGGMGNERRILWLSYSLDALNWFSAGCVALSPDPVQAFMYAHMIPDGDDLLLAVRTSVEGNNHDAELITLHCVEGFRRLALNLHPEV